MADPAISLPEAAPSPVADHSRRQLEALLDVSEIIAQHRDLNALFHELATRLRSVVDSDFLTLVLYDPEKHVMRLHVLESRVETEKHVGLEHPVDNSPSGWVWQTQQPFIVEDVLTETRFKDFLARLSDEGVRSFAALPLTTAQRRLGSMGFGRLRPQAIPESDVRFMQRVAAQVAVAVDNALNFESSQAYQQQLAEQRDRLQVLLDINNVLVTSRELGELFRGIVSALSRVIHHDYTSLALLDPATNLLRLHALDFDGADALAAGKEITAALDQSPAGRAILLSRPVVFHGAELDQFPAELIRVLQRKEIDSLKDKLAVEKLYLEEEIRSELNFEEIVGESPAIKHALAQVELAAPANTTVLVLGETGTGKELIARAIHNLSSRR